MHKSSKKHFIKLFCEFINSEKAKGLFIFKVVVFWNYDKRDENDERDDATNRV